MRLNSFDDIDKWIFRALLYYNKVCSIDDKLAPFEFRKVTAYFSRLIYNRKETK